MDKTVALAATALVLSACSALPITPPPVVAVVRGEQKFPPKPLSLLYATFQDHAVLQRDKAIPVWGQTAPGATVQVSFNGATTGATADANGRWHTELPAMKAGGPYSLSAKSSNGETQTVKDVLIGDVYLCSGQSNMEMPLRLATNYDSELRGASNPNLRLFHVQRFTSPKPKETFGADASWTVTTPDTAKEFSATCYYFGRDVQPAAGVPVGLIEDAWGGSAIQAWISNEKLASLGGYEAPLDIVKTYAASPKDGDIAYRALLRKVLLTHDPAMSATQPWFDPALDDANWESCTASGGWQACPTFKDQGIYWLRKTIELTSAEAESATTLLLGQISNNDLAFVNGTEVGGGEGYDVPRVYPIPAHTLHAGKNVIAIAIMTGGGLLDTADKMGIKLSGGAIKPLAGAWKWKQSVTAQNTPNVPHQPWLNQFGISTLYNGMIVPLGPTPVRGILWYQGETDTGQPAEYRRLLKALVEDWRTRFGAETPFYAVQLPGYGPPRNEPGASGWAETRESQRLAINDLPNTGLAVATDLGVWDNIHPQQKQAVGQRLALLARQNIYGQTVEGHSPAPLSATLTGKTVTVRFAHTGTGLVSRAWNKAIGFSLCTADNQCHWVDGVVGKDAVTMTLPKLGKTVLSKVRFCWADSPMCNLYSAEGLPAVPFEMDITRAAKGQAKR